MFNTTFLGEKGWAFPFDSIVLGWIMWPNLDGASFCLPPSLAFVCFFSFDHVCFFSTCLNGYIILLGYYYRVIVSGIVNDHVDIYVIIILV